MNKNSNVRLIQYVVKGFLSAALTCCATIAMATSIPNNSPNPKTFLGPSVHLGVTKAISDNTAYTLAGEVGLRNFRVGGTLGWELSYYQRLKASAELLRQKITYSFFDGRQNPWLNQGALGLAYQYDFHETAAYSTQIDLAGYISHAPSKDLGTGSGTYIQNGTVIPYSIGRRIAGSNAAGISPGITFSPWYGTRTNLQVNYDNVRYDTTNTSSHDAKGLGGTVRIDQLLMENVTAGVSAAVRQPFNNYQADITWGNISYYGLWTFKIYSAYTIGKNTLPTTYDVGAGIDYYMDADNSLPNAMSSVTATSATTPFAADPVKTSGRIYKDRAFKDPVVIPPVEWEDTDNVNKELLEWTAVPAVYMPQVLAIADNYCVPPGVVGVIPDQYWVFTPTFDVAPYFKGSNLAYSINIIQPPPAPPGASISGSIVTILVSDYFTMSITATNACGSATSNIILIND